MFAADIRRHRISRTKGFHHWRWHLDEMFVQINGKTHYLWLAVDHEGEILESYVTKKWDKKRSLAVLQEDFEAAWIGRDNRHRRPLIKPFRHA